MSYDPEAFDASRPRAGRRKRPLRMTPWPAASRPGSPITCWMRLKRSAGVSLLDVATGPGYVAERAVARGAEVIGLDLSEAMLEFARARVADAEFVRGDATALPFEDSSFAAVTAAFVLLHLGQARAGCHGGGRACSSPGGRVAFTVWDVPTRGRWLGVLLDAVADVGATPPADIPPGPPIFRFADDVEFARLLSNAGLADAAVETIDFSLRIQQRRRALARARRGNGARPPARGGSERRDAACNPCPLRGIAGGAPRRRRLRGTRRCQARLGTEAVSSVAELLAEARSRHPALRARRGARTCGRRLGARRPALARRARARRRHPGIRACAAVGARVARGRELRLLEPTRCATRAGARARLQRGLLVELRGRGAAGARLLARG